MARKRSKKNLQSASRHTKRPKVSKAVRSRISKAVKKAFARITPKERKRRAAIRKGLEKSKHVRKQLKEAQRRTPKHQAPPGSVDLSTDKSPGRYVWLLKEQKPEVASQFVGREEPVEARLVFQYTDVDTGRTKDVEKIISFDAGEDDQEFWDNFHDATRDELEGLIDEESEYGEGEKSGSASAIVSHIG